MDLSPSSPNPCLSETPPPLILCGHKNAIVKVLRYAPAPEQATPFFPPGWFYFLPPNFIVQHIAQYIAGF